MRNFGTELGIKYVRVPVSDDCEKISANTPPTSRRNCRENSLLFCGLLARLALITFILIGRKFGLVLVVAFVVYYYFSSFLAISFIVGDLMRALYNVCDNLLYHPDQPETSRTHVITPSAFNLPYEEVILKTADGVRLHSYLIKQRENSSHCPTILYLHGNAGNIGHRLPHAQVMFSTLKVNILFLEYRGYGKSEGIPSEKGLYRDAQAGLDYVSNNPDLNESPIYVFGRSLGGAVAIHLASCRQNSGNVAAVIVENTFTSIPSLAKVIISMRLMRYVPRFFYKSVFASEDRIASVSCPSLFISGLADTLIPPTMMRTLFNKCGANLKRLATFESGTHNQTWHCRNYLGICKEFVDSITAEISAKKRTGEVLLWSIQQNVIHTAADIV